MGCSSGGKRLMASKISSETGGEMFLGQEKPVGREGVGACASVSNVPWLPKVLT